MWFLAALSVIGVVLNIKKDRRGFVFWIATNGCWAVIDFRHGLYAQAVLFVIYFILALWGWIRWEK